MALIEAEHLTKEFTLVKKQSGLLGSLKSLFRVSKKQVRAIEDISFAIEQGEIVGYIGPNGAGKSTTIKMLTGILHPTSGEIRIAGISPQRDRKAVVKQLGVVFGQRTQLYWDLRLGESFELMKRIYRVEAATFRDNMRLMDRVLGISELCDVPVRQLSLGQRMKGDLAAAMLHSPSILFLDEPTIGLDVEAKHAIRNFIQEINRQRGVTVILTTHDLDDVEQLCKRLIVVNRGKLVQDGPLDELIARMAPHRLLVLDLERPDADLSHPHAEIVKQEGSRVWYRFDKHDISAHQLISQLSARLPVIDLCVKEPDIEDAIRQLYRMQS
jgi:ABC-2 type transport system ATP-binding protein